MLSGVERLQRIAIGTYTRLNSDFLQLDGYNWSIRSGGMWICHVLGLHQWFLSLNWFVTYAGASGEFTLTDINFPGIIPNVLDHYLCIAVWQ